MSCGYTQRWSDQCSHTEPSFGGEARCHLLRQLQRVACLAITGACSTAPQAALETLLSFPTIDAFIQAEARATAFRLKSHIKENHIRMEGGHSSITNSMLVARPLLLSSNDRILPRYNFNRSYKCHIPPKGDLSLLIEVLASESEIWFTDASVNVNGCGFGYHNTSKEISRWGHLGLHATVTQAEITAIINCALEVASDHNSNDPVWICSDSIAAIRALKQAKISSMLVKECTSLLEELAAHRNLNLIWVPAHSSIRGNETADILAKRGASSPEEGPEPFLPLDDDLIRSYNKEWLRDITLQSWLTTTTCSHSKQFVQRPNDRLTKDLLSLDRAKIRLVTGVITGHIALNAYLARIGARADADCDFCGHLTETAFHFLCECTGFSHVRKSIYGTEAITADAAISNLGKLITFTQRSGRVLNRPHRSLHHPLTVDISHSASSSIVARGEYHA